ncbi:hypothetical protein AR546_13500 [Leptospira interrogans serovar Canicola]|nr:hypothetical protein AR546_13500 [Leptospira interrogans serovar Canicola]OMH67165.1 hypothetical protein BW243_07990 [Leptospira interrogans serovar Pomona]POR18859.1 hypothetical protein B0T34_07690 [Leptospira interrogans serovar Canicola]
MLKNSIVEFNKTTSIDSFHTTEIDGELIFQQLYFIILYTSYTTIKLQKRNVNFRKSYRQIFM